MIPVKLQIEPADFDTTVRKPGNAWLLSNPGVKPSRYKNFWKYCLKDLASLYGHFCAYLAIYIEPATGAESVDHFVPKSDPVNGAKLAYEWNNYRLCGLGENRKKRTSIPPLDPCDPNMKPDSFFINFGDGSIYPNPAFDVAYRKKCQDTIDALKLDGSDCREMRKRRFEKYARGIVSIADLKEDAPFIYQEVVRQGL